MTRALWPTGAAALLLTIALTIAGGTEDATPLLLLSMDLAAMIVWLCMVLLTRALTRSVAGVASTQPSHAPARATCDVRCFSFGPDDARRGGAGSDARRRMGVRRERRVATS
jgi:hypothetical protein